MKINQRKLGSILSYAQMAISIIIGIIYTPMMIQRLGQSQYGLYNIASSTISMMSLLSLGFNSGYIRYYSKYKKDNDQRSINKLNGLFLTIFTIIGIISLVCGLFLSFNLDIVFDKGLTESEYAIARVLMILLTISLSISFPMSVFSNIISAHERFVFLKLLGIGKTVVSPLVNTILLLSGYRSIAMVCTSLAITLVVDTIYLYYVFRILKQRFVLGMPEPGLFKSLFTYTIFIALNMLVDQINLNIDKILLGRFKGTTFVSIYTVGYTLHQYYQIFSTSISGVFSPAIHRIVSELRSNKKQLRSTLTALFIKVGRVQYIILMLLCTGVIFFGRPFISFWAGPGYEDSYYVALLLMIPSTVPLIENVGIETQRALNNHQFRAIVYIIMALINFVISIFLCQMYGAIGSALGTTISVVIAHGLIMNTFYHKKCYIDMLKFWKNILRISLGLIIPIAAGITINLFVDLYNIYLLIGSIAAYTVIYALSMWFIGMNEYEKNLLFGPIRKIFKKR